MSYKAIKPNKFIDCPWSGPKLGFETKEEADRFLKYNGEQIKEQNGYAPIRAYRCKCGYWHLTSKEDAKRQVKLSELKPRYPLHVGIRYHLGGIITYLDEAVTMLERDSEEDYKEIRSKVYEALSRVYDLKISPYKDEMLSVQKILFEFARNLYIDIGNSLSMKSWIESEIIYESVQDWKYYMSFLGYLKLFKDKRVDNPRVKYVIRNKDSFEEGNIYIRGLYCLRNYFVILNTGDSLTRCKTFYDIIEKMTDEILIEDLKELKENIPIL